MRSTIHSASGSPPLLRPVELVISFPTISKEYRALTKRLLQRSKSIVYGDAPVSFVKRLASAPVKEIKVSRAIASSVDFPKAPNE